MAKKKAPDEGEGTEAKPAKKKAAPKKKPAAAKKPARGKKDKEPAAEAEVEAQPENTLTDLEAAPPREEHTEETPAIEPPPAMSEEEQELSAIYGEELSAPAKPAHGEYQDQKTRDEDRPMLPEINAREERRNQWQDRREHRKRRREERDRERQARRDNNPQAQQQQRPQENRPPQQQHDQRPPRDTQRSLPPVHANGNGHDAAAATAEAMARVGTPLGDAAASVFAELRNNQPLPVRQLAAMMRKRSLVQQDPEQLWPQLKAELLGDERSYRGLGLRPRIVYRGRDLFAPGPVSTSQTAGAEANVAQALSRLAGATHRALAGRLAKASAAGFERIIHAYLVAAGYREIEWVKRVSGISYASAVAPGLSRTILISARSGDAPIDRRAVGELRVGVEAKDLVAGILFAPGDVSEDAERELERAGRSIAVICGEQLVAALVQVGVGVVSAAAPLHYLDDQLLDEILAG